MKKYAIAVHGGAGTILRAELSKELEKEYNDGLLASLQAGVEILEKSGSALNAVQVAATILEDNPLFNAGKGSVFTHEGKHEMDAAIMDGKTLNAGSVAAVSNVKNPIMLARAIMEKSGHVF